MISKNIIAISVLTIISLGFGASTIYFITQNNSEGQKSTLLEDYDALLEEYNQLYDNYTELKETYDILVENNIILTNDYTDLVDAYNDLVDDYNLLLQQYQSFCEWIKGMILPAQYMVFAEAVRRYYFDDFYISLSTDLSSYWYQFARFCRDIVLHDSQPFENQVDYWFSDVSNAFYDCLRYDSRTPLLAWRTFRDVFDYWHWGEDYYVPQLTYAPQYVQCCIDSISYEYDDDITEFREEFDLDYIKFPVETAFRTMGDCEDQAILCAAYLESCGYETALAIFHDAENPNFEGGFYHGTLLVHIEDTTAYYDTYSAGLWSLGGYDPYEGYTWCWLDTTWDTPFGTKPGWLQYYSDNGITWDDFTLALCDLDGDISL